MRNLLPLFLLFSSTPALAGAKEAAVERAMQKIWQDGDMGVIAEAYEEELGNEIARFVQENRELYPDIEIDIVDSVIKGNRYVTVWTATGTHKDLGKKVSLEGVSIRKREGGKFVEEKMFYDQKSIYDQLGFVVSPPAGVSPFEAAAVSREEAQKPKKEVVDRGEAPKVEAPEADEAPAKEAPAPEAPAADKAPPR